MGKGKASGRDKGGEGVVVKREIHVDRHERGGWGVLICCLVF